MELREATPAERRKYYNEEWNPSDIPDFLRESISYREFGFDPDGRGPRDRYNEFKTTEELAKHLRGKPPYSAYSSVSYYEKPSKREGYMKAELVFDIDAKDLPPALKKCCPPGLVCGRCLDVAKGFMLSLKDIFKEDFGITRLYFIYSGRGYHLRILDPDVMEFSDVERAYILDYLSGSHEPVEGFKANRWLAPRGYTRIFKDRLLMILEASTAKDLIGIEDIGSKTAKTLIENKQQILEEIKEWKDFDLELDSRTGMVIRRRFKTLNKILSERKYDRLTDYVMKQNASMLDAKVTVDVKRILRLPSSLHSKVSMKCMLVKDIESFDPLVDALPDFLSE